MLGKCIFWGKFDRGKKGQKHFLLACQPMGASVIDGLSLCSGLVERVCVCVHVCVCKTCI